MNLKLDLDNPAERAKLRRAVLDLVAERKGRKQKRHGCDLASFVTPKEKILFTREAEATPPEVSMLFRPPKFGRWTGEIVFGWKQEQPASGIVSPLTVYSRQTVIGISDSLGQEPKR